MAAQPRHPKMPPLTALRAFEAAGRLGGFTPAAHELGVTPGAITAHLKTLESQLGVPLFERRHRGVELTDLGAAVLPEFTAAFRALDQAVHQLQAQAAPNHLSIATTPDIAALWLSPRLPALRAKGLRASIVTVPDVEAAAGADLGVFFVEGEGTAVAVASERWVDIHGGALPEDQMMTLAGPLGDWAPWLQAAGLQRVPRGPVFDQAVLALEEAANGAGAVVLPLALARRALEARRVEVLQGLYVPTPDELVFRKLRKVTRGSAIARAIKALGG